MASITVLNPNNNISKIITVAIESSIIAQDLNGEMKFFITLSTTAKDVTGTAIDKQIILSLRDGTGGDGIDRKGSDLPNGGKYNNLTEAINDYVALMVEGKEGEPWTEMNFA